MKKILLGLTILLVTNGAQAADTGLGTIGALTFSDGGNLFFNTSATPINPAGCTSTSYVIAGVNAQFKNYYAMMLTAQASGSDVLIRISDTSCLNLGGTNYPRVQLVQQRAS